MTTVTPAIKDDIAIETIDNSASSLSLEENRRSFVSKEEKPLRGRRRRLILSVLLAVGTIFLISEMAQSFFQTDSTGVNTLSALRVLGVSILSPLFFSSISHRRKSGWYCLMERQALVRHTDGRYQGTGFDPGIYYTVPGLEQHVIVDTNLKSDRVSVAWAIDSEYWVSAGIEYRFFVFCAVRAALDVPEFEEMLKSEAREVIDSSSRGMLEQKNQDSFDGKFVLTESKKEKAFDMFQAEALIAGVKVTRFRMRVAIVPIDKAIAMGLTAG